MHTIMTLVKSHELTPEKLEEMHAAYVGYLDALAPFQPTAETVNEAFSGPQVPWASPEPCKGDVFYFLPMSGGYWVAGKERMGADIARIMKAMVSSQD